MTACQSYYNEIAKVLSEHTEQTDCITHEQILEIRTDFMLRDEVFIDKFPHVLPPKNKSPCFPKSRKERRKMRKLR